MSNQMLNASASPHGDLDAIFEQDYVERDDAETLTLWAFRRWVMGL